MKILIPLVLAMLLASCGGGGNSGGSNGSPDRPAAPSETGVTVSFSSNLLVTDYVEGAEPGYVGIGASATGATSADFMMGAEVDGPGIATPIRVEVNPNSRTAMIFVTPQRGLPLGLYKGTIRMFACTTRTCSQHHGGSPHTVNYTLSVTPRLTPSPGTLAMTAAQTTTFSSEVQVPLGQSITLFANVTYTGESGWLTAQVNGDKVSLLASAGRMQPGTYKAALNLAAGSQQTSIPVSFIVSGGLTLPDSAALTINSATSAEQLRGKLPLGLAVGLQARVWNASSNQSWLILDKAGGDLNDAPSWRIDAPAFSKLANNSSHQATITVNTDTGLPTRTFTLDVHKAVASISGLDRYALRANQPGHVMIYGNGFDTLPAQGQAIMVGRYKPNAVARLSSEVMQLSMPAMPAGEHEINFGSTNGVLAPPKSIKVLGGVAHPYQSVDSPGVKGPMVWDEGSQSAFVINRSLKSIMRYAKAAGRFQLVAERSLPVIGSIGMAADGNALVVQSAGSKVYKLSPLDLSTIGELGSTLGAPPGTEEMTMPLAIMGNNKLFHPDGWIDLDSGQTTTVGGHFETFGLFNWGAVSRNGLRLIRTSGNVSDAPVHFDVVSAKFSRYENVEQPYFRIYSVDRSGNTWAFNDRVVDFNWTLKGNVELPPDWGGLTHVLSSNGAKLYYLASNIGNTQTRIYVLDTSKTMPRNQALPVLGHIDLIESPHCKARDCRIYDTDMAISEDDETLFLAGDTRFMVVPITASLLATGPASSAPVVRGSAVIARPSR